MQLFKTEMIFLHPPRTRVAYGARPSRAVRYGGRLPARTETAALPRPRDAEAPAPGRRTAASPQPPAGVERAA